MKMLSIMMKPLLFLLLSATCSLTATAQDGSLLLVEEGRTWNTVSLIPSEPPRPGEEDGYYQDLQGRWGWGLPHSYVLKGDTVMGGVTYGMLWDENGKWVCGLCQEGSRVYRCNGHGDDTKTAIFDFALQVGDIFKFDDMLMARVESVDKVCVDGVERRRLKLWAYEEGVENKDALVDIWVEGIGSYVGGPCFVTQWATTNGGSAVQACVQDGHVLFSADDFITTAVISSAANIRGGEPSVKDFYDYKGRRLNGEPQRGLYIVNGSKVLIYN